MSRALGCRTLVYTSNNDNNSNNSIRTYLPRGTCASANRVRGYDFADRSRNWFPMVRRTANDCHNEFRGKRFLWKMFSSRHHCIKNRPYVFQSRALKTNLVAPISPNSVCYKTVNFYGSETIYFGIRFVSGGLTPKVQTASFRVVRFSTNHYANPIDIKFLFL